MTSFLAVHEDQPDDVIMPGRQWRSLPCEQTANLIVSHQSSRQVQQPNCFHYWVQEDELEHLESAQAPTDDGIIHHHLYFHSIYKPMTIAKVLQTPEAPQWKQVLMKKWKH